MKRPTHLLLGAATAIPVALTLSPGLAAGAVWWGMVGGGWPDWFDLRSDFRRSLRLRHRGASHGLPFGAVMTVALALAFAAASESAVPIGDWTLSLPSAAVIPWTLAFALGFVSHLVADACTYAGIRPFLPLSSRRVWLLPKLLRGQSSGPIDFLARWAAFTALLLGIALYGWLRLA